MGAGGGQAGDHLRREALRVGQGHSQRHCLSRRLAICTLSLGVLKHQHSTMFQPALPREKVHLYLEQEFRNWITCQVEAIERMGFGVIDKIFLRFSL